VSTSKWLTKEEAADHLRVKPRTIDRWAAVDKIRKYKIDGLQSVRFDRDELDRLVVPAADRE
jgi:excisionase family DNA binding protein